jgi:Putative Flp pilus-assembly TadE/G-like
MVFTHRAEFRRGQRPRGERGQTILLVAISIVSLLMMAALAIDVVSLYVASTEIQRSADAAALAGAKAMADSGVTTLQASDANLGAAESLAQDMATKAIQAILAAPSPNNNQVAGGTPVLSGGTPTFNWAQGNNNPHITVTLQQSNLPTFFARVFGSRSAIATASATAEAYNPANLQSFTPVQTTCVKPWLIGNEDPDNGGAQFVTPATGQVETPPLNPLMGEQFWLSSDCNPNNLNGCTGLHHTPPIAGAINGNPFLYFVPLEVNANAGDICPSSTASPCGGGNDPAYKSAIECCNITPYTCGGKANYTQTLNPEYQGANSDLAQGTECLIHASGTGLGQGQDTLDWQTAAFPTGPPKIKAGSGPQIGNFVSTSSSIVTIPILDNGTFSTSPPYQETVVGFLQAFVNEVDMNVGGHRGDVYITVLNVIGCSQTPNGNTPVVGGNGASPIPVRLITPP